jgi:hypothetical protein
MRRGGAREAWHAGPLGNAHAREAGAERGGSATGHEGSVGRGLQGRGGSVSRVGRLGPGDRLTGSL